MDDFDLEWGLRNYLGGGAKRARCPGCGATISPDGILCDRCHERGAVEHDHGGPLGAGSRDVCNPCDDTEPDPDFLDLARAFGD